MTMEKRGSNSIIQLGPYYIVLTHVIDHGVCGQSQGLGHCMDEIEANKTGEREAVSVVACESASTLTPVTQRDVATQQQTATHQKGVA